MGWGPRILCRWGGVPGSSVGGLGSLDPLEVGWGPWILCSWVGVPRSSVGRVGYLVLCRWGGVPGSSLGGVGVTRSSVAGGVGSLDPL